MPFSARSFAVPLAAWVIFASIRGSSLSLVDRSNNPFNFAIVEENALSGPGIGEDCRKRTTDLRGLVGDLFIVVFSGLSGNLYARQEEIITCALEKDSLRLRAECP